jgi:hypothetical protein
MQRQAPEIAGLERPAISSGTPCPGGHPDRRLETRPGRHATAAGRGPLRPPDRPLIRLVCPRAGLVARSTPAGPACPKPAARQRPRRHRPRADPGSTRTAGWRHRRTRRTSRAPKPLTCGYSSTQCAGAGTWPPPVRPHGTAIDPDEPPTNPTNRAGRPELARTLPAEAVADRRAPSRHPAAQRRDLRLRTGPGVAETRRLELAAGLSSRGSPGEPGPQIYRLASTRSFSSATSAAGATYPQAEFLGSPARTVFEPG